MIKIFIKNIYSQIMNLEEYEDLYKELTIAYEGYWFSPRYKRGLWDGKYHFLKIPTLKFATGLIFIVKQYLKDNDLEFEIVDQRTQPNILQKTIHYGMLQDITLRDYQMEAVAESILKQRGVLEIATGLGKTEIAAGIIKALQLKTLFLVHTKDLLHQTVDRFSKRLMRDDIGILGDSEANIDSDIIVATVQTLGNALKKEPKECKKFLNTFQIMFQDECHHASSSQFYKLGMFMHNAFYRFGLSGTPFRRDKLSDMKVLALMGDTIYQKSADDGISEGFLSNIEVRTLESAQQNYYKRWPDIYRECIVQCEQRNRKIVDIAIDHLRQKDRVLIMVRLIEHGEILQKMLINGKNAPTVFLHGKHESWERARVKSKFNEKGGFILIASDIFSEGIDVPEINTLILAGGGKSEVKAIQRVGRGLRKKEESGKLIVYDFMDSAKFLDVHSKERFLVYKKEGFLK